MISYALRYKARWERNEEKFVVFDVINTATNKIFITSKWVLSWGETQWECVDTFIPLDALIKTTNPEQWDGERGISNQLQRVCEIFFKYGDDMNIELLCSYCNGKGRWYEKNRPHVCEHCNGTGLETPLHINF